MENASKALLMAGGVLIAIVTIAFLVKSLSTVQQFQMSQLSAEEQEQLTAFNEQYTKYVGQYVYGTEVITVINKSLNNTEYPITVNIKFAGEYTYKVKGKYNITTKKYDEKTVTIKKDSTFTISNEDGTETANTKINDLTRSWL